MKKTFLLLTLFISTVTVISCSSDDDASGDPLIGKWKIVQELENDVEQELGCDAEGLLEFTADGNFEAQDFDDDGNDNCELDETINGTWSNEGDSNYKITINGESDTIKIAFENNRFYITDVDGDFTYITVYQKQ